MDVKFLAIEVLKYAAMRDPSPVTVHAVRLFYPILLIHHKNTSPNLRST